MEGNKKHKDRVFRKLFGYEKYKGNLLELYNALNDSNYTNPDDLEINTLDDVFYMNMKNDVSCIIDWNMAIYEHQSTWSYNMPLRGYRYSAELYNDYIVRNNLDVFRRKLIKIPTPQYYVFYNGNEKRPDREVLKLSDAFMVPCKDGEFEWTATVLNINAGHNEELMSKCSILREYAIMVSKIKEFLAESLELKGAIKKAIDYCLDNNVLKEFLQDHRSEVEDMLWREYNEEETMAHWKEDFYEEGEQHGLEVGRANGEKIKLIKLVCKKLVKNKSIEEIADDLEEDVSTIEKICNVASKFAPEFDVDSIMEALEKE